MAINDVATLKLIKSADKQYAGIGDVINYTIGISNIGNTTANNIMFLDTIPSSITFINNSFKLNGITQSGATPLGPSGAVVGSLASGGVSTVSFSVHVNTIPVNNIIENFGGATFNYTQDPSIPNGVSGSSISNTVITRVRYADVTLIKSASTPGAKIGDIITYTVLITNIGNIPIQNLLFTDTISTSLSFIENSAEINGSIQSGVTPDPSTGGMNIAIINPGETITISFDVEVISAPEGNVIDNTSSATVSYLVDPNNNNSSITIERYSNTVSVNIDEVIIDYDYNRSFVKSVDKAFADICEVLTYTLVLHNSGNVESTNVIVTDTIPNGTTFIPNSVFVNGVQQNKTKPSTGLGINVGTIPSGGYVTITFKVEVVTIPSNNIVSNSATVGFRYVSNTNCPSKEAGFGNSNIVTTAIRNGDVSVEKYADRYCANIGDIITYTVAITNRGNVAVQDIELKDILPPGTTFIGNTIRISCKEINGTSIQNGLNIPCLEPNKTIIITFEVRVDSVPVNGKIKNVACITYEYCKDNIGTIVERCVRSNEVVVLVNSVDFEGENFTGTASRSYAAVGDVINYNFNITNGGNIVATNVIFIDSLPDSLTLVEDSIRINGIIIEGLSLGDGIDIGGIQVGESINIGFDVKVTSIPDDGISTNLAYLDYRYNMDPCKKFNYGSVVSNEINVVIKSPNIVLEKTVNPQGQRVGGEVTYTVKVYNFGNVTAFDVVLRDILNPLLELIPKSLYVDGECSDDNIINGVNIGKISVNKFKVITFKAKVLGCPSNMIIPNVTNASYKFIVDPSLVARQGMEASNICYLQVGVVNVVVDKKSNVKEGKIESRIKFTVTIKNIGTVKVSDFVFKDILSSYLEFDNNSFKLNGVSIKSVNLKSGVRIGNININECIIITYFATIKKTPSNCKAENLAFGEFDYKINKDSAIEKYKTNVAKVEIKVPSSTFKQVTINQSFIIPEERIEMQEVEEVRVQIDILDYYITKNCNDVESNTGNKIIINGFLINEVEYTADDDGAGVYLAKFRKPFTSYVLLPKNHDILRNLDIKTLVEDISYKLTGPRDILVNVVFMIDVRLL